MMAQYRPLSAALDQPDLPGAGPPVLAAGKDANLAEHRPALTPMGPGDKLRGDNSVFNRCEAIPEDGNSASSRPSVTSVEDPLSCQYRQEIDPPTSDALH